MLHFIDNSFNLSTNLNLLVLTSKQIAKKAGIFAQTIVAIWVIIRTLNIYVANNILISINLLLCYMLCIDKMNSSRLSQKRRIKELQNFSSTQTTDDSSLAKKRFCGLNLSHCDKRNYFNGSIEKNNSNAGHSFQDGNSRSRFISMVSL